MTSLRLQKKVPALVVVIFTLLLPRNSFYIYGQNVPNWIDHPILLIIAAGILHSDLLDAQHFLDDVYCEIEWIIITSSSRLAHPFAILWSRQGQWDHIQIAVLAGGWRACHTVCEYLWGVKVCSDWWGIKGKDGSILDDDGDSGPEQSLGNNWDKRKHQKISKQ